jgi:hypothetical protein
LNTEQAHSHGRTRFRAPGDPRKRVPPRPDPASAFTSPVPATWLNLVCLDAPIVAVLWLLLFARTFELPLRLGNAVALFLTAWLIYLADRLADAASLKMGTPRSLRQRFCLRHREIWICALVLIGGFDLYVIWRSVPAGTFISGAIVGGLALIYLALNYPRGLIWRALPAKEIAIGFLFTAGTLVPLLPVTRPASASFFAGALAFACLCSLNCMSIARWEQDLDLAQEKVSLATRYPGFAWQVGKICGGLALVSVAMAIIYRPAAPVFVCACVSAVLLAWLNAPADLKEGRFQNRSRRFVNRRSLGMNRDERTAFADLVLLTPIIPLIAMVL